jgi:hypothetical protein
MRGHNGVYFLVVFLLALFLIAVTFAEAGAEAANEGEGEMVVPPPQETDEQPYTWEQLATIPGAIAATLLIVQYLKFPLDKVWKIPTRFLVLIIAFGLMTLARGMVEDLRWIDVPLIAINAFVVALAAMGAYEVSFKKLESR